MLKRCEITCLIITSNEICIERYRINSSGVPLEFYMNKRSNVWDMIQEKLHEKINVYDSL